MKIFMFALICAISGFIGIAAQSLSHPASLHWSKEAKLKSPDRKLQIEVHPILTDEENHSPVVVHRLEDGKEWNLFTLTRAAQAIWRPDSQRILVIDEPTADNFHVQLFSPEGQKVATETDEMLRSAVMSQIGSGRKIEFYLPTFVSWKKDELIIAVGGTSFDGIHKSTESFCFVVSIGSDSGQVLATKKQPESHCRLNP